MPRTRSLAWSELKLGIIVVAALVLAAFFAFMVGGEGGLPWQRIYDFGNDTNHYHVLTPAASNGKLRSNISLNSIAGEQIADASFALPIGVWTHVAAVLNGDVCPERPCRLLAQELRQRGRSDAAPPVFSPYPITDEASAIGVCFVS